MCSLVWWQLGETLGHFRTRWDIDVMFNWVTLLPLQELIQTSVFDAHCQGWEEVSSFGPAWVARPPPCKEGLCHDAPQWASGLCSVTELRMATLPSQWCLYYTTAVDTHTVSDWVRGRVSRPVWRCLRSPPNQDLSALVMYLEQCQRFGV